MLIRLLQVRVMDFLYAACLLLFGLDSISRKHKKQAAVFGSEDCELTEALWASTERQKLKEFSEKLVLTATAAAATATSKRTSTTKSSPSILQKRRACTTTTTPSDATILGIGKKVSSAGTHEEGRNVPSPSARTTCCACAPAADAGANAAPCSSSFGDGSSSGVTFNSKISSESEPRGQSTDKGNSDAAAATGDIPPGRAFAAAASLSEDKAEEEETLELMFTVGGALRPPCDPEITHPESLTD